MPGKFGHNESGALVPVQDFDYDAVDQNLFPGATREELEQLTQTEIDAALKLFRLLLSWIWQSGMKNPEGIQIRAILVCWIFMKELRPLTLTQMATGFGKKKQSLGRWHDNFKRRFPDIITPHMRPLQK